MIREYKFAQKLFLPPLAQRESQGSCSYSVFPPSKALIINTITYNIWLAYIIVFLANESKINNDWFIPISSTYTNLFKPKAIGIALLIHYVIYLFFWFEILVEIHQVAEFLVELNQLSYFLTPSELFSLLLLKPLRYVV